MPNDRNGITFTITGQGYRVAGERDQRGLCSRSERPFYSRARRTKRHYLPLGLAERWHVRTIGNFFPQRKGKRWSAQTSIRWQQSPAHPVDDIYDAQWKAVSGGKW